jgi:hypothetical protein
MDVKDVRSEPLRSTPAGEVRERASASKLVSAGNLNQVSSADLLDADLLGGDPVSLQRSAREGTSIASDARARLNRVINVINVASQATEDVSQLAESLGGIVEQVVQAKELPEYRRSALENEANQIVQAIGKRIRDTSAEGSNPLTGDKVRVEIEEKFGRSLEILLPDSAKDSFGLTQVKFSQRDAILDTRTQVEVARRQIESLRDSVSKVKAQVESLAATLDVAIQNGEATTASIRELEDALSVANSTGESINDKPQQALDSVGPLGPGAARLLGS